MYTGETLHRHHERIQVKICGITAAEDAMACTAWGVDAIGLVFYPKSPRYVTPAHAADITGVLPPHIARVGVFVNESEETIMAAAYQCRLHAVQLHGAEPPELARRLMEQGLIVIKCLYVNGRPAISEASQYHVSAFLVECSAGKLPGGNAMAWDWSAARGFNEHYPTIIAGGLSPKNVAEAIAAARPDAVDVSSGVESAPGRKDTRRVRDFVYAVRLSEISNPTRRIF
ncbi:MAG: phosphoribosylanthranilate isomerase [Desulfobacterales bacterium]